MRMIPSHVGQYEGVEIACVHSELGFCLIMYPDKQNISNKCLLPGVVLVTSRPRVPYPEDQ